MSEDEIKKMQQIVDDNNKDIEEYRLLIKEYQWEEKQIIKRMDEIDKELKDDEEKRNKLKVTLIALMIGVFGLLAVVIPLGTYGAWTYFKSSQKIEYSKCLRDGVRNGNKDIIMMLPCRHLGPLEDDILFLKNSQIKINEHPVTR